MCSAREIKSHLYLWKGRSNESEKSKGRRKKLKKASSIKEKSHDQKVTAIKKRTLTKKLTKPLLLPQHPSFSIKIKDLDFRVYFYQKSPKPTLCYRYHHHWHSRSKTLTFSLKSPTPTPQNHHNVPTNPKNKRRTYHFRRFMHFWSTCLNSHSSQYIITKAHVLIYCSTLFKSLPSVSSPLVV